jgi:eukaryotic-like serine/threonine-protein kinase
MHDHAGGLVEHQQVVVFEEDVERDVLRRGIERHGLGDRDGDKVAGFHGIARLGRAAIHHDVLLADERLDARARQVGKARGEVGIEALAGVVIDSNFHGTILPEEKVAARFKFAQSACVSIASHMPDEPETIAYCHSCGAAMNVSAVAPFSNVECPKCGKHTRVKREFGPYTLIRRHAIGGMSMVFVAHDNTLDREVALKILSEEFSRDERRITAFEEEARITASFSHPNVVRVLRTGRAFERFYIAMEFVPGGHFEHHIRERGRIPEAELLPLAIEVAQGLKAAHAAGLIHRDVKPGNILLDAEGHAKLVDFGLALVTLGGKARAKELWATPYYVPPETVEGHEEDFRSDIYALGSTLYHALAGTPPCGEETMATDILREAKRRVVPLSAAAPDISAETCHVIERAMAYEPSGRYQSYDELIAGLGAALSHLNSGLSESPGSAAQRRAVKKRQERKVLIAGSAVVVAAAGVALWWVSRPKPEVVVVPPPPLIAPAEPVAPDKSADIARSYREARAAMDAKDFKIAALKFREILNNPAAQEPTRSWAGLEAVLAHYLDGQPPEARVQARETLAHLRALPEETPGIGGGIAIVLGQLGSMPPVFPPDAPEPGAARVIAAMLAGLKNWEQGMLDPAAACFKEAVAATLPPEDEWASAYQEFAARYLDDHEILTGPLFSDVPVEKAAFEAAIDDLNAVLATLKTRGRARFNVRAWQLDLARRAKLLETANAAPIKTEEPPSEAVDVLERLVAFAEACQFRDAIGYLKTLPENRDGERRASLLALAESAAVFLSDLEYDLAKQPVDADLKVKSGETIVRIAIDPGGRIIGTSAGGETRAYTWSDFSPDALIVLHREVVKNPAGEIERLRRHECAIAYDWLAGNRERALAAAAVLSESSSAFRDRWQAISKSLPE